MCEHTSYMKKRVILITSLAAAGIVLAIWLSMEFTLRNYTLTEIQKEIAKEVLRFHVKGHSDSVEDQRIKMQVKEAVVSYLDPWMEELNQVEDAKLLVENHLPEIKMTVQDTLNQAGCSYGFHMEIGESYFPEKVYGDCTFPKGVYEAFIITLGEGDGRNWWCMLYPGLCFFEDSYRIVTDDKAELMEGCLVEEKKGAMEECLVEEEKRALEECLAEEKKESLESCLTKEAYQWIVDEKYRKEMENVEVRIRFKCLEWFENVKNFNF